jgi:molybdate transport system regulatory protein
MGEQQKAGDFSQMRVQARITLYAKSEDDNASFGKGVASLLEGIRRHGSINQAAKDMGMSYSKAWRIINECEEGFGFNLVARDGARGSLLTPDGDRLLTVYLDVERNINQQASADFQDRLTRR